MPGLTAISKRASPVCSYIQVEGASPLFPPVHKTTEQARLAILHVVRRDPRELWQKRSGWTLKGLLEQFADFTLQTPAGPWRLLERLDIRLPAGTRPYA